MEEKKVVNVEFKCTNCGDIHRDDVIFLCNKCGQEELILKDGIYMCPSCLVPGENFECLICESKEVNMKLKDGKKEVEVQSEEIEKEEDVVLENE